MLKPPINPVESKLSGFKRLKNLLAHCLLSSFFLCPAPVHATPLKDLSSPNQEPVNIESDSAHFDEKKGIAVHSGHVSVHQGDRILFADSLEIHRNRAGSVQSIIAKGNPATFEASPNPNQAKIQGTAQVLQYFPSSHKIILLDAAKLQQADKKLEGASITYHFDTQTLVSDANPEQPTKIILENREPQ